MGTLAQEMKTFMIFTLIHPLITAPQYGQSSGSLPSLQPPAASASQSVSCRTENQVVWDTKYVETETQECSTISVPKCSTKYKNQCRPVQRQQCQTVNKQECDTQYEQQCSTQYKDELEYYTETECKTDYKKDCEYHWVGTGNNKVWTPIPGTCNNNAYDSCGDVQKQKLKQVPYQDCKNVPRQISRNVPKKVCDGGSGYGGGSNGGSGFNSGSGFNGNNGSQGGFNGGNGVFRNTDPDAEFLSEKLQIKPKSGDAVNFGK